MYVCVCVCVRVVRCCVEYGQVSKILNFDVEGFDLSLLLILIPLLQLVVTGPDEFE